MSFSEFEYNSRLKKLNNFIHAHNLDYILLTNLQNIFYYSGTAQYGILLINKDYPPRLFIRRNYFRAKQESVLEDVIELNKTSQIVEHLRNTHQSLDNLNIGMELDSLPTSYFLIYQNMFKGAELINIEMELRKLRMIKEKKELEILRKAGKVAQKCQEAIPKMLKSGIKEYEIAAEVMYTSMKNKSMHFSIVNGMQKNWFIVASGKNLWNPSSFPILSGDGHSKAVPICYSNRTIQTGDIVVCDYGMIFNGYHADHARTYYVETYSERFKEIYLILKEIYLDCVADYLQAGKPTSLIYDNMKRLLEKEKLGKYFQGDGYYYQGLGHGIGLELDEPPYILPNESIELEENMVISLEPKIIIPNWGAIDFEDNFIIKKGKPPEQITNTSYLF